MRCVSTATASALGALAAAALLSGCGNLRERDDRLECATYETGARRILDERCVGCHGGTSPAAGYSVQGHLAALSLRPDGTARIEPGDASSALLRAAAGGIPGHQALPDEDRAVLNEWVVDCRGSPEPYQVHLAGWMSPPDEEQFHGAVLRRSAYDYGTCRECHGDDLGGGQTQIACAQCHARGVDDCGTCHGSAANPAPPRSLDGVTLTARVEVGAHQVHVTDGPLHKAYACGVCHAPVTEVRAEGHFLRNGGLDPSPAEVVLRPREGSQAAWNRESATCSNGACHAPAADDPFASLTAPRWTGVGEGQAVCGTCHGLPPGGTHPPEPECRICHLPAYAQGALDPARHADGTVDLAGADGACNACHGDATSPAPPRDLEGNTSEQVQQVGAHRAHLEARHLISARIACSECHLVPQALASPGHIDSARPAEVFPAGGVGPLAGAGGATPAYDPSGATCTAYCHGGGTWNADDAAQGLKRTPQWTGGTGAAACGACHGIPPRDTFHDTAGVPTNALQQCVTCHPTTMNATGNLIVTVDPGSGEITTTHLNGTVNIGSAP